MNQTVTAASAPLHPTCLQDVAGRHAGESIIVCGCGSSLTPEVAQLGLTTIGVNDVGRLFDPTYLVVLNPARQFKGDRFNFVRQSRAQALFTQLDLGPVAPPVVRFQLGRHGGTEIGPEPVLHHTQNSPYLAVCLAAWMGARRIGLIGVDFTDHHFFARTGRHPLSARLQRIDEEYTRLADALQRQGIELINLSPVSRLQGLPRMSAIDFAAGWRPAALRQAPPHEAEHPTTQIASVTPHAQTTTSLQSAPSTARVFVVNYRFVTCGDVFTEGLRNGAHELGIAHAEADCLDPRLPEKIEAFAPDLVLVVHGRRFAQRWGRRLAKWHTAVWLVDEPYEVDDTANWSHHFDTVFVNDPGTLSRHVRSGTTAHHLPMAHDPVHCHDVTATTRTSGTGTPEPAPRRHRVGFIGGANPSRERLLLRLAEAGLLSYVVGGPWRSPVLRRLCLAQRVPHQRTAELYRQTELVLHIYRDQHHFNAQGTREQSPSPRTFEALACGALVVSERRDGVLATFPELPVFEDEDELVPLVQRLLDDTGERERRLRACQHPLGQHRYADRLAQALALSVGIAVPVDGPAAVRPDPSRSAPPKPMPQLRLPSRPPTSKPHPDPVRPASADTRALAASTRSLLRPRQSPSPLPPLVAAPRRHLMYHLWPVKGETWRWNVELLLQRIDLFNGRRLIAIVTDERTEDLATVQAAFAGHGVEFIVRPNAQGGESITFPLMLAELAREHRDDVAFYAHAKGVKYEPTWPPAVKRWAEVQMAVTLDHWPTVRAQLDHHAMTGLLRRPGRFANHQHVGDWHYSGTCFWFRHDAVFQRAWQDVPAFYGGVEAWPGMLFSQQETGCLLLDQLRELPYRDRFWATRGNPAFERWRHGLKPVPPPADLLKPLPFEGHHEPRLEQHPQEFAWWLGQLMSDQPRHLLVIGDRQDGVAWHARRVATEQGLPLQLHRLPAGGEASVRQAALGALPTQVDAVFIDGMHGDAACEADVQLALGLGARHIALHDIVDSDWHAASRCCVSRVWARWKAQLPHEECIANAVPAALSWGGIGILRPPAGKVSG